MDGTDRVVRTEFYAGSVSENTRVQFTCNVQYAFEKDASPKDKNEALEDLLKSIRAKFVEADNALCAMTVVEASEEAEQEQVPA